MIDRSVAPAIKDAVDYRLGLKPYEYSELDNGVPVYSIRAGEQEVVQLEMIFYAGNCYEQIKGIAAATNFLLKNGTRQKTAFEINEAFDYYGAYFNRHAGHETASLTLHTLSKHLPALLPVMEEILTESVFLEEELTTYCQNAKQRLKVNLQKADFVANRLIDGFVFGETHPYGSSMSLADFDKLDTNPIRSFYKKYYQAGQCLILISGNFPPEYTQLLNTHFGKLDFSAPPKTIELTRLNPVAQKQHRVQNEAGSVQGAIRLATPFPNRHHPDFKKAAVLNNVFGGFFGSRLMSNIREDKGFTYGIHSYLQNHRQETAWVVSTEAGKDVCEETVKEVHKEMQILRDVLIPADELMLVRNFMIGGILGDLDGPFHIAAKWKNIITNGLDEQYFYDTIQTIKTVTAAELKELANKYFLPDQFYDLIVY